MTSSRTHTKKRTMTLSELRVFFVHTFGVVVVSLILVYLYLVNASVISAVGRKQAQDAASDVATHVADLEAQYFSLSESLTLDEAYVLGFVEPKDTLFALRMQGGDTRLTMR